MVNILKYVAGIDISKLTFDISISINDSKVDYSVFANNAKGFKALLKWLSKIGVSISGSIFCMENTGIYHRALAAFLHEQKAFVWVENAAEIKWSLGIQRGKNDKADSLKIMKYAKRNIDKAKPYKEKALPIQKVSDLLALRRRLVDCVKKLSVPIKELKKAGMHHQSELIYQASKQSIEALSIEIKKVEVTIKNIISENEKLSEFYKYATSVKSIGFIAACQLIVHTNCFTKFKSVKQIASYCGIAPFEYSSGTSIKGRTRVHHMANKELKTALHMCAINSLAHNDEMKIYFQRKVGEGKNKMLVINAIRNKLLSRAFSCVKNKKMYTPHIAA